MVKSRLLCRPGESWLYSNFGFGVVGTVLTELTGKSYGTLLMNAVCTPLGLSRTGLQPPDSPGPHHLTWWRHVQETHDNSSHVDVATLYHQGNTRSRPVVAERWNDTGAGSGGVVSAGCDMTRFLAAAIGFDGGSAIAAFRTNRQLQITPERVVHDVRTDHRDRARGCRGPTG